MVVGYPGEMLRICWRVSDSDQPKTDAAVVFTEEACLAESVDDGGLASHCPAMFDFFESRLIVVFWIRPNRRFVSFRGQNI